MIRRKIRNERMFLDVENGLYVPYSILKWEYESAKQEIRENSGAKTFGAWLHNCLGKNGFLREV